MSTRLIFDFGNAQGKWFAPGTGEYNNFLHAVVRLTDQQWQSVVGRGMPPKGLLRVNGVGYAVGEAAKRQIIKERPRGAARYNVTYYLPAACYAFIEAFRHDKEISLYASHAPQDQRYAPELVKAVKGTWEVECEYGTLKFAVKKVTTFDEPIGGYAHFALTRTGDERPDNPVARQTVLVIDAGGHTVDRVAVDPGGQIDLMSISSTRTGTLVAIEQFESELRQRYKAMFQDIHDLDIARVESAIISGCYQYGRKSLECRREAQSAINSLVNDVIQIINEAGGAANYDLILLTGGGSALIYDSLVAAFPQIDFVMVEEDRSLMKFANVFGGAKLAALLSKVG